MIRIVVVLPAPFGPTNPNSCPGSTREREPVERDDVAVAARQVDDLEHPDSRSASAAGCRGYALPPKSCVDRRLARLRISGAWKASRADLA
jgi:hypothetical protein